MLMKTKKILRKLFMTVVALIAAIIVLGLGFWLIDGRTPQAYVIAHLLPQATMEDYEQGKGDMTDKSTVEIPDGIKFPREVRQYRVGHMQVFEVDAQDDSKPVVLYIHGGAYLHNFTSRHWNAMVEWATVRNCRSVSPPSALSSWAILPEAALPLLWRRKYQKLTLLIYQAGWYSSRHGLT